MSSVCSRCGMAVSEGFKFCSTCGSPVDSFSTDDALGVTKPYSVYTGIQGRGLRILTGERAGQFVNLYPGLTLGRTAPSDCVFPNDMTVSPLHARITCRETRVEVEDLNSLNGVFVRVKEKLCLQNQDMIRAGGKLFLYEEINIEPYTEAGTTEFYGSPVRGEKFRLVEILRDGFRGRAYAATDTGITVGRNEGNFLFKDDETMSSCHFSVRGTQRGTILSNMSSLNGTFIRMRQAMELTIADQLFIGNTLLEVI